MIVRPERVAVTPLPTWKTPTIVAADRDEVRPGALDDLCGRGVGQIQGPEPGESSIVCGEVKTLLVLVSKLIVLGAGSARLAALTLVLRFAQPIAARNVSASVESAAVLTR